MAELLRAYEYAGGRTERSSCCAATDPQQLYGDVAERHWRERVPAGCLHEQLIQQFCGWIPRPRRWRRYGTSGDRVERAHDLLLSGSPLRRDRCRPLFSNVRRYNRGNYRVDYSWHFRLLDD